MKSNRKGQVAGQVFIYIMAVIIIAGIALVGYSAIKSIVNKSCDAEKATFKTDIEGLIEKYTSYGSVNKKTVKAPCGYDTICFVDASMLVEDSPNHYPGLDATACTNALIRDSAAAGIQQNIFVKSAKNTVPVGYSDLITLSDTDKTGCLCVTNRNKNFYITFTGRGSSTEISNG